MSAFYIARVKIKDQLQLEVYASKALPIFASFGGELLSKGQLQSDDQLLADHDFAVVMAFPSLEILNKALKSDAYQNIIPIRQMAADVTISCYG